MPKTPKPARNGHKPHQSKHHSMSVECPSKPDKHSGAISAHPDMNKFQKGDQIEVTASNFSHIHIGMMGTIDEVRPNGVEAIFTDVTHPMAGIGRGKEYEQKQRVIVWLPIGTFKVPLFKSIKAATYEEGVG